jgi:hypothetical protein
MKRLFFLFIFIFTSEFIFAQSFISRCISYLGKPIPDDFNRISETVYKNDNIILHIENNIVVSSVWTKECNSWYDARLYYVGYTNLFENMLWIPFVRDMNGVIYKCANIYAGLVKPGLDMRVDGVIEITVIFYLREYYDRTYGKGIGG